MTTNLRIIDGSPKARERFGQFFIGWASGSQFSTRTAREELRSAVEFYNKLWQEDPVTLQLE